MRIRWNRVFVLLAALAIMVAWPRISALLRNAGLPDIVPALFPSASNHEQIRALLVLATALICVILLAKELMNQGQ